MLRTGDLFGPKPRRAPRVLLAVVDAGQGDDRDVQLMHVHLVCTRCQFDDDWSYRTAAELRAGVPCPNCN